MNALFEHAEFSPNKALKWSERLAILIGVAKAVHFLHTGMKPGCFRNQLKTNNILLDEHRFPKLSDYGMSIITEEIENNEVMLLSILFSFLNFARCFWSYLEWFCCFLCIVQVKGEKPKLEDDVYNFGFILFESLAGPIASEKGEAFFLNERVKKLLKISASFFISSKVQIFDLFMKSMTWFCEPRAGIVWQSWW